MRIRMTLVGQGDRGGLEPPRGGSAGVSELRLLWPGVGPGHQGSHTQLPGQELFPNCKSEH